MTQFVRLAWPATLEAFETLVARGTPVVFEGAAAGWPCTRRWTPAYLRERLDGRIVKATYSPSGQYRADPEHGHYAPAQMKDLLFGEFMDRICETAPNREAAAYYLHRQGVDTHLPELRDDVPVPEYLTNAAMLVVSLWMGPSGSVTPIHHDYADNLFAQVRGRKRLIVYDPEPDSGFYRLPFRNTNGRASWHISGVGSAQSADLTAHPLFRHARSVEMVVEPGDIVFIPSFYWHEVHSLDTPSISLSYWWDKRTAAETEAAIAKVTELMAFHESQPPRWRSLIERIVAGQRSVPPREHDA